MLEQQQVDFNDEQVLRSLNRQIGSAIKSSFGNELNVIATILNEDDSIEGIFNSKKDTYWFTFSPSNQLSYRRLSLSAPMITDSGLDPYWDAFYSARMDGVLLKKKCTKGVPCGSTCIPKGTVCQIGIPTAKQALVAGTRFMLKATSRLARTAAKVAMVAGVTAIAAYAAQKAQTPEGQEKIQKATKAVGISPEFGERIKDFSQQVATKSGLVPATYQQTSQQMQQLAQRNAYSKMSLLDKAKLKTKIAVNDYVNLWKTAPAQTALGHLGVGMLLFSAEQTAEQLGYIPKGTAENMFGANRFRRKRPPKGDDDPPQPNRVNNRKPKWGG